MAGLPTPREPCYVKDAHIYARKSNSDYTDNFLKSSYEILELCQDLDINKAYLLKNSPACGKGYGIIANLLDLQGIELIPI